MLEGCWNVIQKHPFKGAYAYFHRRRPVLRYTFIASSLFNAEVMMASAASPEPINPPRSGLGGFSHRNMKRDRSFISDERRFLLHRGFKRFSGGGGTDGNFSKCP